MNPYCSLPQKSKKAGERKQGMRKDKSNGVRSESKQLCTFYIGDHQFGINILKVREISRNPTVTAVPHSQNFIVGIMNLRGSIITVIDLAQKVGLSYTAHGKNNRTIIVDCHDESIGLLVDSIGDVTAVDAEKTESPPVNIDGVLGRFTKGVLKTDAGLIGILDVEALLA
jgi:purine-binding chemotaxis protein CheW